MLARAKRQLDSGYPWNALSVAFEGLCEIHGVKAGPLFQPDRAVPLDSNRLLAGLTKVREELASFVDDVFPEDLSLESPGTVLKAPYKEFLP
jgi:hypothetical protein